MYRIISDYQENIPTILKKSQSLGHPVFTKGEFNINLVAVRNPFKSQLFNDLLCAYYIMRAADLSLRWTGLEIPCTVDPGAPYTKNSLNPEGPLYLKAGFTRAAYTVGLHKGLEALVQQKPMEAYRDTDRDGNPDKNGKVYKEIYGANIHRAGSSEPKEIGLWSAGCIVPADHKALEALVEVAKIAERKWGKGISFTMLEE